jgi:hypothetical protein
MKDLNAERLILLIVAQLLELNSTTQTTDDKIPLISSLRQWNSWWWRCTIYLWVANTINGELFPQLDYVPSDSCLSLSISFTGNFNYRCKILKRLFATKE